MWEWRSPKPRNGYVSLLLLDERQLIASVNGYTYCLHPRTGQQQWVNELKGFGTGVTSIVASGRYNPHDVLLAAASADAASASAGRSGPGHALLLRFAFISRDPVGPGVGDLELQLVGACDSSRGNVCDVGSLP